MEEDKTKGTAAPTRWRGYPIVPMRTDLLGGQRLAHALLCEIDMRMEGQRIVLEYSNIGSFDLGAGDTIEAKVKDICEGWRPDDFPGKRGGPRRSRLSLNNKDRAYLIFLLNPKRNWRFSSESAPFSLFAGPPDVTDHYGDPVLVDQAGNQISPGAAKSNLAYFAALGDQANNGQNGANADRFNLHIELEEEEDRCIPIIIDPDVGHPGGSYP